MTHKPSAAHGAKPRAAPGLSERIVFHDASLLVINKPSGMAVFAERSGEPCLWDEVKALCANRGWGEPRPVHRLDKGTSGVWIIALNDAAQQSLNRQFARHAVQKWYVACVCGRPSPGRAAIDLPLQPGRKSRYRVAGPRASIVLDRSQIPPVWKVGGADDARKEGPKPKAHASRTTYRMLDTVCGFPAAAASGEKVVSRVAIRLLTGRRHQIRVHLSWLGWPIEGDALYPPRKPSASSPAPGGRMMLHCHKICVLRDWDCAMGTGEGALAKAHEFARRDGHEAAGEWLAFRALLPGEFRLRDAGAP